MDPNQDPFGHPIITYLWVISLATVASIVRYLNSTPHVEFARLLIEGLSGGFTGLLTFWLCQWQGIEGPRSAFLIGVSGLMGARVWNEFMEVFRARAGVPNATRPAATTAEEKSDGSV